MLKLSMLNITSQARDVYNLCMDKPLTAKEIAGELNIFPNAVYRAVINLEKFGFVRRVGRYPARYISQQPIEAVDLYTNSMRELLLKSFNSNSTLPNLDVSFIENREDLIEKTNQDLSQTKEEACFIVSGLEVPAETILENKKAIERGVKIRMIVQNLDEAKKKRLLFWKKMGIEIRYYPSLEARIILFDSKAVYITSYDSSNKQEGKGVRFNYASITHLMQDLFNQRWTKAKKL